MSYLDKLIEAVESGDNSRVSMENRAFEAWPDPVDHFRAVQAAAAYDGSLDAAKALHEALLPEWRCILCMTYPLASASVFQVNADESHTVGKHHVLDAHDADPARAWLLAILKAYRAKGQDQ